MESKSSIYISGKSCFLDLAKGPCGGNLRKRFKLCVMAKGCSVCSSERRRQQWSVPVFLIYLGQCSIFILERNVLNISWSLLWNERHESGSTIQKSKTDRRRSSVLLARELPYIIQYIYTFSHSCPLSRLLPSPSTSTPLGKCRNVPDFPTVSPSRCEK